MEIGWSPGDGVSGPLCDQKTKDQEGFGAKMRKYVMIFILLMSLLLSGCTRMAQTQKEGTTAPAAEENITKENAAGETETGEEEQMNQETEYEMTPMAIVAVRVGDRCFTIDLADNSSAEAFFEKINGEDLEIHMSDYGGFEKVGDLPWDLPTNDEQITTKPGDIILYQGNKITIYYDENTWNFTKLGELRGGTPEDIEEWKETFGGKEDITATFFTEWTE